MKKPLQEMTVDPEDMDKSSNQYKYNATRRYIKDPTMKMEKSKNQNQGYDYVKKISESGKRQSYDYVDHRSFTKIVPEDNTGYIYEEPVTTNRPTIHTKDNSDDLVRTKTSNQTNKPKKSETKLALQISKHTVGKGKNRREGKGAYHDTKKGSANLTKKKKEVDQVAHEVDVYEVTNLHNSTDINHTTLLSKSQTEKCPEKTEPSYIKQNEDGPDEEKSFRNNQQNYENYDFEKKGTEQTTGSEQEYLDSLYENISETSSGEKTPSNASTDSSPDQLYRNTLVVNVIKCENVNFHSSNVDYEN